MPTVNAGPPNTEVTMVRGDMENIPNRELPAGYRFRAYRDGDDRTWLDLHIAGEPFIEVAPDLFARQFGANADILPERMVFVETDDGIVAGCITAWWEKDRYGIDERGRIHWVIVHPEHRRRGIAKAMMTRAMATLSEHYRWAMLGTSSGRPFAIKTYLDYGFRPDPTGLQDGETVAAWERVQAQISHPALQDTLDAARRER